ncbi:MAG: metallophosphoesterase [Lachnospiraceae bacterium]|nr:metallophosphoesterase [Lachnospiraceae bacterium]
MKKTPDNTIHKKKWLSPGEAALLLFVILVYYLFNLYVFWRFSHWLKLVTGAAIAGPILIPAFVLQFLTASTLFLSYALPVSRLHRKITNFCNAWLCWSFCLVLFILSADAIRLVLYLLPGTYFQTLFSSRPVLLGIGMLTLSGSIAMCRYGVRHAKELKETHYTITIPKKCPGRKNMRIVLTADQHMGYAIGADFIEEMANCINEAKPDLVCISGDLFDNHYDCMDDPDRIARAFKSIRSTYGTYAVLGNHDVEEQLLGGFSLTSYTQAFQDSRIPEFLLKSGITLMQDDVLYPNEQFYLAGRKDGEKPGDGTRERMSLDELLKDTDPGRFMILLDHEPHNLKDIAEEGIDLNLGGHTHGGQFFPLTLPQRFIWQNHTGCQEIAPGKYSIVTSGVGVYGPAMRIGTDSEIVIIDVRFEAGS